MILLASFGAISAEAPKPSPAVEAFVRVHASIVVLAHVRVIDGTGKPAVEDQNVVIEHGKISRIENAHETPANSDTTVLEMKDYTVIPGIVGMHNHLYYSATPNYEPGRVPLWDLPRLLWAAVGELRDRQ